MTKYTAALYNPAFGFENTREFNSLRAAKCEMRKLRDAAGYGWTAKISDEFGMTHVRGPNDRSWH